LNSRLDFRLNSEQKELITQASSLSGKSFSDFAVSTLVERAREVVHQHNLTVLSNRDRDIFLALLDAPPPPNRALKQAAKRYRKRYG
jgi:uncharacterized protein (DUF1778 family)